MGIPTAVTGLLFWWLKRAIDKRDREAQERERNRETFLVQMLNEVRANYVLSEATAKAVQRIPDAHCNGDMTAALEKARKMQEKEKQYILENGVRHIFE